MTTVVGILGGIGSGKSTVAHLFRRYDAIIVDADEIARDVTAQPEVVRRIAEEFGGEVLTTDGALDRAALAVRVFGEGKAAALQRLEKIVHPLVRAEVETRLAEARRQDVRLVILDVPLLLEKGYRESCDRLLFVRTDRASRLERVATRGWDEEELERRESAQTPLHEKMEAADFVIDNDGDLAKAADDVRDIVAQLSD